MAKNPALTRLLGDLRKFYRAHGRGHLPWRQTRDPYHILVSEVMLQQTQVDRVVPFYERFIKKYPTAAALAKAPLPQVLTLWQGLGYNRRAKYLHEAAKILSKAESFRENPRRGRAEIREANFGVKGFSRDDFAQLPGVGPYTRGAVLAFAFNEPEVFIETNIRTVFFHYVGGNRVMSDAQLVPLVAEALERSRMEPRHFYAALMDYGSHLKRQGIKLNGRSKHYVKQTKFKGSARELRGAILRELLTAPATEAQLIKNLSRSGGEVKMQLIRLRAEGLVAKRATRYEVAR